MSSPPERVEQSDVHEDAIRAFKQLAMKAAIFLLVPVVAALMVVLWWLG